MESLEQIVFFVLGKFKRSKLKKEPGSISFPSDFRHTITVQQTLVDPKGISGVLSPNSPPGSPAIPRLRAIARKYYSAIFRLLKNVYNKVL